jgi:hypothetical protein
VAQSGEVTKLVQDLALGALGGQLGVRRQAVEFRAQPRQRDDGDVAVEPRAPEEESEERAADVEGEQTDEQVAAIGLRLERLEKWIGVDLRPAVEERQLALEGLRHDPAGNRDAPADAHDQFTRGGWRERPDPEEVDAPDPPESLRHAPVC